MIHLNTWIILIIEETPISETSQWPKQESLQKDFEIER